jgi:hypothetical protein
MNKYIIISFILCVIIIYLYFKNHNREHFEVPTTGVDVIQDLTNIYIDPNIPITFNKIKANSVTAESMNGYIMQPFTPVQPLNDGSIMRLGDKGRGNGWKNYTVNIPSYLSMTFSATLGDIVQNRIYNLLSKNDYLQSQISDTVRFFNFSDDVSGTMNEFLTFYGPFDETKRLSGLKYDSGTGTIKGFNPEKLYKIDCNVSLYDVYTDNSYMGILLEIKNGEKIICSTVMTSHHNKMTHSFRLVTYSLGITYEGIKLNLSVYRGDPGKSLNFWNTGDWKGRPNTTVAIMVEEIRNGL